MAKRYELTAAQWHKICNLLPGKPGDPGRCGNDNLLFVNAVLWVLRLSSKRMIERLIHDCPTPSTSAACRKLPFSAAATK